MQLVWFTSGIPPLPPPFDELLLLLLLEHPPQNTFTVVPDLLPVKLIFFKVSSVAAIP